MKVIFKETGSCYCGLGVTIYCGELGPLFGVGMNEYQGPIEAPIEGICYFTTKDEADALFFKLVRQYEEEAAGEEENYPCPPE